MILFVEQYSNCRLNVLLIPLPIEHDSGPKKCDKERYAKFLEGNARSYKNSDDHIANLVPWIQAIKQSADRLARSPSGELVVGQWGHSH